MNIYTNVFSTKKKNFNFLFFILGCERFYEPM